MFNGKDNALFMKLNTRSFYPLIRISDTIIFSFTAQKKVVCETYIKIASLIISSIYIHVIL